tara:strand:+ start:308 stop:721 length:414 start_codon:yes stop_codon:yes gene_type:complete
MSWATNYQNSKDANNVFTNVPANMGDGRFLKDLKVDQDVLNKETMEQLNMKSNGDYRKYLQNNAGSIMKANSITSHSNTGNMIYFKPNDSHNPPFHYDNSLDTRQPAGYNDSDLKNYYLSREQLNRNMVSPSIQIYK